MDRAGNRRIVRLSRAALFASVLLLGLAPAQPMTAQVRGLPVYNAGVPRGIGLALDVGFPNEDAGHGVGYGLTASAGIGLLGVTGTVGAYNPDGPADAKTTVGGTLNYRLFGGPLVPLAVTMQGGVGYYKPNDAVRELHFPVGVGFALTVPNPALAIKPWLAPRVDIVRRKVETSGVVSTSSTDTETNFGLSAGLELNFLNGFGLHAAYDLVFAGSQEAADVVTTDFRPGVFGVGAHYAFRLPLP